MKAATLTVRDPGLARLVQPDVGTLVGDDNLTGGAPDVTRALALQRRRTRRSEHHETQRSETHQRTTQRPKSWRNHPRNLASRAGRTTHLKPSICFHPRNGCPDVPQRALVCTRACVHAARPRHTSTHKPELTGTSHSQPQGTDPQTNSELMPPRVMRRGNHCLHRVAAGGQHACPGHPGRTSLAL